MPSRIRFAILVAALLSAALLSAAPSYSQVPLDTMEAPQIVPFEFDGHIFLDVKINGMPAVLLYDPIRNIMLDTRFAGDKGISLLDGREAGYGGSVTTGGAGPQQHEVLFARDVQLRLADLTSSYALTPVIPLDSMMAGAIARKVHGLIGINVLADYIVEFDFPDQQMLLHPPSFRPPGGASELPITWMERRPTIPLDIWIGGEMTTIQVMVDFGMSGPLRFTTRYVNEASLVDRMQATAVTNDERGMGGALTSRIARLPRLHIGKTTLDSVVVSLAREEQGADAYREWDALIGLELLSRFTLYLDLSGDRLWLRPNAWIDRPYE